MDDLIQAHQKELSNKLWAMANWTRLSRHNSGVRSVRTTPLLYFLRASTNARCLSIFLSNTARKEAMCSCSRFGGTHMGIAKKASSFILTRSCLAPLSPDIYMYLCHADERKYHSK